MLGLYQIYHITCVLTTLGLVSWCYFEYSLNEDATQIHNREFHKTPDDIYPSTTICLNSPFKEEKLKEFDPDLTTQKFRQFLMGYPPWEYNEETQTLDYGVWNKSWIDIDYDYVTYQLTDLISSVSVKFLHNHQNIDRLSFLVQNNSLTMASEKSGVDYADITEMKASVSARAPYYKCFTFDVPFIRGANVYYMDININASIFPSGEIRPRDDDFVITFGYPHQLIQTVWKNAVFYEKKVSASSCYSLETTIGSMEVLHSRDKLEDRCNRNWQNQDEDDLKSIMTRIGCNPKYWEMETNLPYCSNETQYQSALIELKHTADFIPPCKAIEKLIQTTYEIVDGLDCHKSKSWSHMLLRVWLYKITTYKEILLVRAFNIQSLIGTAGKEFLKI